MAEELISGNWGLEQLGDLSRKTYTAGELQSRGLPLTPELSSSPRSSVASQPFCSNSMSRVPSAALCCPHRIHLTPKSRCSRFLYPATLQSQEQAAPISDLRPWTPALTCSYPELGSLRQPCLYSTLPCALWSRLTLWALFQPPCCDCFIPVSSVQPVTLILSHRLPPASLKFSLMVYTLHAPFTMERGHVLAPQVLFQLPHSSSCDFCTLLSAKNLTSYLLMSRPRSLGINFLVTILHLILSSYPSWLHLLFSWLQA